MKCLYLLILMFFASCNSKQQKGNDKILKSGIRNYKVDIQKRLNEGITGKLWDYYQDMAVLFARDQQMDSAFHYVNLLINQDSSENIFYEPAFYFIMNAPQWKVSENRQFAKNLKFGSTYKNKDTTLLLWRMHLTDQAYYTDLKYYENFINGAPYVDSIWNIKLALNKKNQDTLEQLVEKMGWPKLSDYGNLACTTAFLIIQHADLPLQKKYLPVIEKYCQLGESSWEDYCLMIDRILVREGKPQMYGTQLKRSHDKTTLDSVADPIHLNKRRKEKGLPPINEYLKYWNIQYDVPQRL